MSPACRSELPPAHAVGGAGNTDGRSLGDDFDFDFDFDFDSDSDGPEGGGIR